MIRPGDLIAGGACGMGPCPPLQHQPPVGAFAHDIYCISMYIPCIYMVYTWILLEYVDVPVYTMQIPCIYMVYTLHIHGIYTEFVDIIVYTMYIQGTYKVYTRYIQGIYKDLYKEYSLNM
jgi:hypothetical protein